jgi:hypothetical protein
MPKELEDFSSSFLFRIVSRYREFGNNFATSEILKYLIFTLKFLPKNSFNLVVAILGF